MVPGNGHAQGGRHRLILADGLEGPSEPASPDGVQQVDHRHQGQRDVQRPNQPGDVVAAHGTAGQAFGVEIDGQHHLDEGKRGDGLVDTPQTGERDGENPADRGAEDRRRDQRELGGDTVAGRQDRRAVGADGRDARDRHREDAGLEDDVLRTGEAGVKQDLQQRDPQTGDGEDEDRERVEGKPQDLRLRPALRERDQHHVDADGGDDRAELLLAVGAQPPECHQLDQHRERTADRRRGQEGGPKRQTQLDQVQRDKRADHEDGAMRKIENFVNAEHEVEPQGEQRINAANENPVDELLQKHFASQCGANPGRALARDAMSGKRGCLPGPLRCGAGLCGACTVHIDGRAVRSCQVSAGAVGDGRIVTIEGLSAAGDHPVQRAWIDEQVPQCGYCQPGMIMAAAALLAAVPKPSDREIAEAMTNLCRCGTYPRVTAAIKRAASV